MINQITRSIIGSIINIVYSCSNIIWLSYLTIKPGSSGSIVSDYGLDKQALEVWYLVEAKDFSSSLCVQTGSGAHPASCQMGTGGLSPGVAADQSPAYRAEVINE
jgi:hypothetical protein